MAAFIKKDSLISASFFLIFNHKSDRLFNNTKGNHFLLICVTMFMAASFHQMVIFYMSCVSLYTHFPKM